MLLPALLRPRILLFCAILGGGLSIPALAQNPPPAPAIPSASEVAELLRCEPLTEKTWPAWRERLLAWISDLSRNTSAAYDAARDFIRRQIDARGELTGPFAKDAFAWYLLGSAYLKDTPKGTDPQGQGEKAERALRRSLQLDPTFARAHRNLAMSLWLQVDSRMTPGDPKEAEGRRELVRARQLDPTLKLKRYEGFHALQQKSFAQAEALFTEALNEEPTDSSLAFGIAWAIINNRQRSGPRAPTIQRLLDRFPEDGSLVSLHGVALAEDNDVAPARVNSRAPAAWASIRPISSGKMWSKRSKPRRRRD